MSAAAPVPAGAAGRTYRPGRTAILIGATIMAAVLAAAVLAPVLAPHDPYAQSIATRFRPPSAEHWLGTDGFGRDTFSRILYGLRVTLLTAFASTSLALVAGTALGIMSGYYGGTLDRWISAANDLLMSFPQMVAGIIMVALLGPGVTNLILAIAITAFPAFYRMARSAALALRGRDYIDACRVLGYSDGRIMLRHILPGTLPNVIVYFSMRIGTSILTAAALSFIGLGAQPPSPEWGAMLADGRTYMGVADHLTLFPGLAIFLTVLGFNLLGDGLRDALDPKLRMN